MKIGSTSVNSVSWTGDGGGESGDPDGELIWMVHAAAGAATWASAGSAAFAGAGAEAALAV